MIINLKHVNADLDCAAHILCDLEPDVREPLDVLLGKLMAYITALHSENQALRVGMDAVCAVALRRFQERSVN